MLLQSTVLPTVQSLTSTMYEQVQLETSTVRVAYSLERDVRAIAHAKVSISRESMTDFLFRAGCPCASICPDTQGSCSDSQCNGDDSGFCLKGDLGMYQVISYEIVADTVQPDARVAVHAGT